MILPRLAIRIVAVAVLIGGPFGEATSQTVSNQGPKTPVEIAKAIAGTINASTPKVPGAQIAFESATSHDNIVELRYVANDSAIISRLKSTADQTRLAKASYYCNEARISYLKQGVVMHEIVATSDNSDHIEFTFDIQLATVCPNRSRLTPRLSPNLH
jgi:hypothetical protein